MRYKWDIRFKKLSLEREYTFVPHQGMIVETQIPKKDHPLYTEPLVFIIKSVHYVEAIDEFFVVGE